MRYWYQNGHRMAPQTIQKRSKKVYHFSIVFIIDFWIDLGSRNPWKWAPRVHEKLIFIKSPFPILTYFLKQKWCKKAPKLVPKWLKKSRKNQMSLKSILDILEGFLQILGVKIPLKSSSKLNIFFLDCKRMNPGSACGDPRAAPGYQRTGCQIRSIGVFGQNALRFAIEVLRRRARKSPN